MKIAYGYWSFSRFYDWEIRPVKLKNCVECWFFVLFCLKRSLSWISFSQNVKKLTFTLSCATQNLKRVAETWMDEFAEYIYQRRPEYRHLSTGDISAQKELRKHLKCKDFKWFMAAVAWDVPKYYPPVEPPPAAWGEVRNRPNSNESNILD